MQDLKQPSSSSPPPPAYAPAPPLTATHSGFTLSVPPSPYYPGDNLRLTLTAPPSALSHVVGDVKCTLEGTSSVELMGKKRYQSAMMINASLGPSGAAQVTSREQHTFAKVSSIIPLRVSKEGGGIEHEVQIPLERTCDCPGSRTEGVLPSFKAEGDEADESSAEWTLEVVVKRKGFLKRDIKLALAIPVSLRPQATQSYPLTATSTAQFNYTASPTSAPPTLSANLSIAPSSSSPNTLSFHLTLSSDPPSLLPSYSSIPPSEDFGITFSLSRRAWTMGIQQSSFGDAGGFHWAARRVGAVSLPQAAGRKKLGWIRSVPVDEARGEGMEFEGEYEIPEGALSVKGCGVAVDVSTARLRWNQRRSSADGIVVGPCACLLEKDSRNAERGDSVTLADNARDGKGVAAEVRLGLRWRRHHQSEIHAPLQS